MPLPIVLACKRLPAHTTHERPFIRVRPQMTPQIVRAREPLRAETTLERGRVFLRALASACACAAAAAALGRIGGGARGVCQTQEVVPIGHAGGGGAARFA